MSQRDVNANGQIQEMDGGVRGDEEASAGCAFRHRSHSR